MLLIDEELQRLKKIETDYPRQQRVVIVEKKNWISLRKRLIKEVEKLKKEIEEIYVTYLVNQEKGEWGALYVFDSEEDLDSYLTSDLWVNKVPEKYGCKPEVTILEPGPIISKKEVSAAKGSWLTE